MADLIPPPSRPPAAPNTWYQGCDSGSTGGRVDHNYCCNNTYWLSHLLGLFLLCEEAPSGVTPGEPPHGVQSGQLWSPDQGASIRRGIVSSR